MIKEKSVVIYQIEEKHKNNLQSPLEHTKMSVIVKRNLPGFNMKKSIYSYISKSEPDM